VGAPVALSAMVPVVVSAICSGSMIDCQDLAGWLS
jgi:hypothetical protein